MARRSMRIPKGFNSGQKVPERYTTWVGVTTTRSATTNAVQVLQQSIQLDSDNAEAHNELGIRLSSIA